MRSFNRYAITLYATQELLDWVKKVHPELWRWTLDSISHRPTVYMIETEDQNCEGLSLEVHCKKISKMS